MKTLCKSKQYVFKILVSSLHLRYYIVFAFEIVHNDHDHTDFFFGTKIPRLNSFSKIPVTSIMIQIVQETSVEKTETFYLSSILPPNTGVMYWLCNNVNLECESTTGKLFICSLIFSFFSFDMACLMCKHALTTPVVGSQR